MQELNEFLKCNIKKKCRINYIIFVIANMQSRVYNKVEKVTQFN